MRRRGQRSPRRAALYLRHLTPTGALVLIHSDPGNAYRQLRTVLEALVALAIFSLAWGAGLLVVLALLTGVWNIRTGYDVGLWQRSHAALGLTWLAIAAFALARGRRGDGPSARRS